MFAKLQTFVGCLRELIVICLSRVSVPLSCSEQSFITAHFVRQTDTFLRELCLSVGLLLYSGQHAALSTYRRCFTTVYKFVNILQSSSNHDRRPTYGVVIVELTVICTVCIL